LAELGRKNEYFIDAKFRTWCKNVKNPHISIALIFGAILGRHSDEHIIGAKSSLGLETAILLEIPKNQQKSSFQSHLPEKLVPIRFGGSKFGTMELKQCYFARAPRCRQIHPWVELTDSRLYQISGTARF